DPGLPLDEDAVSGLAQRAGAGGRERDALLSGLDLARDPDDHGRSSPFLVPRTPAEIHAATGRCAAARLDRPDGAAAGVPTERLVKRPNGPWEAMMPDSRDGEVLFPRWLIIVRRDQNTLYENLVLSFRFIDRVDVLVDRRDEDLRGVPQPIKSERRRRITLKERALWRHVGFRLIFIPGERGPKAPRSAPTPAPPPGPAEGPP